MVTATITTGSSVDRIAELASAGETDLATIEAIRLVAAWDRPGELPAFPEALAQVLNDLAMLRFSAGDLPGARGCFRRAIEVHPDNPYAAENLVAVDQAMRDRSPRATQDDLDPALDKLMPWVVDALLEAADRVGLAGKDVLEVGGAIPQEAAVATRARSWTAIDLQANEVRADRYVVQSANACALPFPDDSFDAAFSVNAFEHISPLGDALAEIRRVLRPGGLLFSKFAPIWSGHMGHHVWIEDDEGSVIAFVDPVVPYWGHLLLTERELETLLAFSVGIEAAKRAVWQIHRYPGDNHVFESEHRRLVAESGLEPVLVEPWINLPAPTPMIAAELERLHPDGGDFGVFGFTLVLRKPA